MKNWRPEHMVYAAAGLIAFFTFVALGCFILLFDAQLKNSILILIPLTVFVASYFVFHGVLEKYIYRKIKLIYKSIYDLKTPKESTNKIRLQDDVLGDVEKEVNQWADSKRIEIQKLKKMEAYRREFLGNVSHELKTPIFNIQGYLDTLIYGGVFDDKVNVKYLKKALENVNRLGMIVADLEMISNIESDALTLNYETFDIKEFVAEILTSFELLSQENNIKLVINDSRTEILVQADKKRIEQVFVNLISNSIKYGKPGGTTKISFFDLDQNILVEITDDGIGIEKKHLSRLFERFYRIDSNRSRALGGTGLGLAIVKHIVEAHHQTIHVRSTPEIGSTFGFTLRKG